GRKGPRARRHSSPARQAFPPPNRQPRIEELESRLAPSCTIQYNFPYLDVICTGGPDTVTLDHAGNFAYLDGGSGQDPDKSYSSIRITGGTGGLTTNIRANVHPVTVTGHQDFDTVNIGDAADRVQGIQASLFINNSSYNIVNVYDQGDGTFRTATIDTVNLGSLYERIRGLGMPNGVEMDFRVNDTRAVNLWTGFGGSTVDVKATAASEWVPFYGVTTIFADSSTDTVNVGNAGSVQGIQVRLVIENPYYYTTINVNDQNDSGDRTVTIDTFRPSGDFDDFGRIQGLAPAEIDFEY